MGTCLSDLCSQIRVQTILFAGGLCAYQILTFIFWVHDKYMTVTALLHCIASILVMLSALTLLLLYLPHMVTHLSSTTKPRKTAAIMILIGGILHFIAACLAISNPLYCNYELCEIHLFVFMILPVSITIILFLDEFYFIFYRRIRLRIVIYSLILFISGLLFILYYATATEKDELMQILFEVIWVFIVINSCVLIICVGCKHRKTIIYDKQRRNTMSISFNNSPNTMSSQNSNPYIDEKIVRHNSNCCCCCCVITESNRKTLILLNSLLLIIFGSSTLISSYFYLYTNKYDLIVCYYCLVVITSWFTGIDCIYYYRDVGYESIQKINNDNPFDDIGMDNYNNDNRVIIEHDDLEYNGNNHNAWNLPPGQPMQDDDPMQDIYNRNSAYD
eukprot:299046_1